MQRRRWHLESHDAGKGKHPALLLDCKIVSIDLSTDQNAINEALFITSCFDYLARDSVE
jgi:hypothetical protein